ncbi:MAG: ATP-binding cassette domain-containing protein, partial [Clostridia bacterium]
MPNTILQMNHITQTFPGVVALDDVSFNLQEGEVHALLGENGAGKSTLMKVLTGVNMPDDGEIVLFGKKYKSLTIPQAKKLGVSMIYQELNLIPHLNVAENIFLGKEPKKNGFVNRKQMNDEAKKIIDTLGL